MKKILVTSETPLPYIFDKEIETDYIPFIQTQIYPQEQIVEKIPQDIHSFIITSKHSAKAIQDIPLEGQFFVVGKNTAQELVGQNREISFISNYAEDLVERILETDNNKRYIFFKGNLTLGTIPDILGHHNIEVTEIECYKNTLQPVKIEKQYDAIVFMSPSAINSFFSMNEIPKETVIFTSGRTTAQAMKRQGDFQIYYPEETTTKESLAALINDKLNA